jgi:hypothetical protein
VLRHCGNGEDCLPVSDYFKTAEELGAPVSAPDPKLEELALTHPWLATLEPYSIDWELIWFM